MTEHSSGSLSSRAEFARAWTVILAASIGVGVGITGLPFYTLGTFVEPLSNEFGWTRDKILLGTLCLTAASLLASPVVGWVADRVGVRRIAIIAVTGLGLGFALMTQVGPSLASYYIGFLVFALLGCATTPIVWTRAVASWFDRARGLALGLTLVGTGLASILGPRLVGGLIQESGWRAGFLGMSAFTLLVALPLVLLFFRERSGTDPSRQATPAAIEGVDARTAFRSLIFWQLGIGFLLLSLGIGGAIVNLVPLLRDARFAPADAFGIASMMGFAIVFGRLVVGYLVDRFHAPYVAFLFLILPAFALAALAIDPHAMAIPATLLLGLAAGAEVDLIAYLVSRYFGLRAYGAIYGVQLAIFGIGAGSGPPLAGLAREAAGSYGPALWVGVALFVVGATMIGALGPYRRGLTLAGTVARA